MHDTNQSGLALEENLNEGHHKLLATGTPATLFVLIPPVANQNFSALLINFQRDFQNSAQG